MGTLKAQIEYMEATRRLVEWNAMASGAKGGEKMVRIPSWLVLILNFMMSDLFEQLIEWAKDILSSTAPTAVVSKADAREEAILKLRAQAEVNGFKVTRWQAGQAVEAAYAVLNPHKTRVIS